MTETLEVPSAERRPDDSPTREAAQAAPTRHLTAAVARGDERAFAEFYELWFDRVFAMARAITRRDESFCLDVVQDCMMRVVRSMQPMPSERAVAAWMARSTFTTAVDRLRQEQRRSRREQAVARESHRSEASVPADLELGEQTTWLRARLAELPVADRLLMQDRFESGKTLQAIGDAHGLTGHAVHGRIWRILSRLRGAAKREFFDD